MDTVNDIIVETIADNDDSSCSSSFTSAPELFASDDTDSVTSDGSSHDQEFDSLDACLNASREQEPCSIASLIRGQPKAKKQKARHLKPLAFVRFNTRQGKPKPVTIRALLDSGGSASLISAEFCKKLKTKTSNNAPTVWNTPGGSLTTNTTVKALFALPELRHGH